MEGKRYNSFAGYYRQKYGERLQKLVIDAGFTCPNRDGKISTGGCTYCDNAAFHPGYSTPSKSIARQIDEGIEFHRGRYPRAHKYLAYFQSYSNTYADLDTLRERYLEALSHPEIVGIVIGTRPDCVDEGKLDFIASLLPSSGERFPVVSVEYGIESCYDSTLKRINRGHDFQTAARAVEMTASRGIDVGAHFILGLPGETEQMLLDQCRLINGLPLNSIKFHQLQLICGTVMEREFEKNPSEFLTLPLDEYLDLVVDILERLRPDICIERVAGEVPPRFVKQNRWGLLRNVEILRLLDEKLEARDTYQGRLYK